MIQHETEDTEDNGQPYEAEHLEWLSANGIDGKDGQPVTGDRTSTGEDDGSYCLVVKFKIQVRTTGVSNGFEYDTLVEAKTVKGKILVQVSRYVRLVRILTAKVKLTRQNQDIVVPIKVLQFLHVLK